MLTWIRFCPPVQSTPEIVGFSCERRNSWEVDLPHGSQEGIAFATRAVLLVNDGDQHVTNNILWPSIMKVFLLITFATQTMVQPWETLWPGQTRERSPDVVVSPHSFKKVRRENSQVVHFWSTHALDSFSKCMGYVFKNTSHPELMAECNHRISSWFAI